MKFNKLVDSYLTEYKLTGGEADGMSVDDLANHHGVSVEMINDQLKKGIEIEYEHTNDPEISMEIAKDHIYEIPDYYDRLIEMEAEADRKLKEAMTASAGGVFGDASYIGQMGGKSSSDFYATGDTRVPKSMFGVLRRQPTNNEKKKKRRKKKTNVNSSNKS